MVEPTEPFHPCRATLSCASTQRPSMRNVRVSPLGIPSNSRVTDVLKSCLRGAHMYCLGSSSGRVAPRGFVLCDHLASLLVQIAEGIG